MKLKDSTCSGKKVCQINLNDFAIDFLFVATKKQWQVFARLLTQQYADNLAVRRLSDDSKCMAMTTKLEHSNTTLKTYWTILNRLLYHKKIPAISPLLVDGSFISDYCKKANLFNNFFVTI